MVLLPKRRQGPEPLPLRVGVSCYPGVHTVIVSPLAYNKCFLKVNRNVFNVPSVLDRIDCINIARAKSDPGAGWGARRRSREVYIAREGTMSLI